MSESGREIGVEHEGPVTTITIRRGLARNALTTGAARELEAAFRALAREIAGFPQTAMRSDRQSLLESRGVPLGDALRREAALAEAAKRREAPAGAARFAGGTGRHGGFDGA